MKLTAGGVAVGASAVFQALDPTSSRTVSKQAFVQGMTQLMVQFRSGGTSGNLGRLQIYRTDATTAF